MSEANETEYLSDVSSTVSFDSLQFANGNDVQEDEDDDDDDEDDDFRKDGIPLTITQLKDTLSSNIVLNLTNRQLYGRVAKRSKAPTERFFPTFMSKCRLNLSALIDGHNGMNQVYMGFSLCGQFFISFEERIIDYIPVHCEYELYVWRFHPVERLKLVSRHRIFKRDKLEVLDKIVFMQFPNDPYKLICYGTVRRNASAAYITILTLPFPRSCKHCYHHQQSLDAALGWCTKHGFILHYMFTLGLPVPTFDPHICLAYPDYLVVNTGQYIHILNVTTREPVIVVPPQQVSLGGGTMPMLNVTNFMSPGTGDNERIVPFFSDAISEISESASDNFSANSMVEAILDDFNDCDAVEAATDGHYSSGAKPFHELNISCGGTDSPVVASKSYHNQLVQNIGPRVIKRFQYGDIGSPPLFPTASCSTTTTVVSSTSNNNICQNQISGNNNIEKKIVDRKTTAEKAYEFTEDNEKCEKLSSFRKKRLAEKKYEFSEDNSENIVPFNSLRRERRFLRTAQNHYTSSMRSPFYSKSPQYIMQSPVSQYSPSAGSSTGNIRCLYSASLRQQSPYSQYRSSPISPREMAPSSSSSLRKFPILNSPGVDSDCSDASSDIKSAVVHNRQTQQQQTQSLLMISKEQQLPKWIKKVVRRYSKGDYENGSLVSGQSRDEYNIPIEVPLLVQTLNDDDQHLDVLPDQFRSDHQLSEMQLIATQRTFDFDQFVQTRALEYCDESQLHFLHCQDYDLKILHVNPWNGTILCKSVIKIAVVRKASWPSKPEDHQMYCLFIWNLLSDDFQVIESTNQDNCDSLVADCLKKLSCNQLQRVVHLMDYKPSEPKFTIRDYRNYFEIYFDPMHLHDESDM